MKIFLQRTAVADVRAAHEYYEEVRAGLGDEMVDELDRAFARLGTFPLSAQLVAGYEPVRRLALRRFPYAVFYLPSADRIEVLRVVHTARSPEAWSSPRPGD